MYKLLFGFIFLFGISICYSQDPTPTERDSTKVQDSLKNKIFLNHLGNGYFPTKYFNFDLRYLLKYNQYEALRTGIGGVTNNTFSEKYRLGTYLVYGFRDDRFKYSFSGSARLNKDTNTWFKISYTNDLQETGSIAYLTDSRLFQFFEPRLLNIELFYKHITSAFSISHDFSFNLKSEMQLSISNINPTFNYNYIDEDRNLEEFHLTLATFGLEWRPNKKILIPKETQQFIPVFTIQYTQSLKDLFKNEFSFSKIDFKSKFIYNYENTASTELLVTAGIASASTPITHMYHAYPNNNTKETILQRFTVAGLTSFETMYFNEFFSNKLTTVQLKHKLKAFEFGDRFKPQLVLISKFAIGNMENQEYHNGINFNTLEKGYLETGLEINKLLLGFGLSGAYRYGYYHLPKFQDNIAFKFTFNITL